MSWAEVKKINSNMETPLDELLLSIRKFEPSSDELIKLYNDAKGKYIGVTREIYGTITPALNGRLTAACYGYSYSTQAQEWCGTGSLRRPRVPESIFRLTKLQRGRRA